MDFKERFLHSKQLIEPTDYVRLSKCHKQATCIYCNFISIAQTKLACRKFKWNSMVKIAEKQKFYKGSTPRA